MVSTNHVFSGFAFIGFVLVTVLLPLHIKARNIGTCALIIWIGLLCLNGFVNSIIWDHNVTDWAPVWCDISSHLMMGGRIGVQVACLCIARHLYLVTRNITTNRPSQVRHRGAIACDLFLVIGAPMLYIVIYYICQITRFCIFEEIGCYPAYGGTQLIFPLLLIWPFIVALIVVVYSGVTIHILIQRGAGFKTLIQRDEQFCRLLALAAVIVTCTFPYSLSALIVDATETPAIPGPGWDIVHTDISHVLQVPAAEWKAPPSVQAAGLQLARWSFVMYAITVFAFFGFTAEAKKSYRAVLGFLISCFGTLAIFKSQRMRQGHFPGQRISVHTPKPSDRHRCPHTASTVDSPQSTLRNSCSPELPDPKMGSNLGLCTEPTDNDCDAHYAHFEMSVLEHPAPVLDIVSVLRCHPLDPNPV